MTEPVPAKAAPPPTKLDEPTLSVVIPVYNEVVTIERVLRKVAAVDIPKEVIVVDDASADGTADVLAELRDCFDVLITHDANQGKGASLRSGLARARGKYVVFQDADLEYDPAEYADLLAPLEADQADVVYGSRFGSGRPHRVLYYRHSLGNRALTFLSNLWTDLNLTDIMTCYKMIRRDALAGLEIEERGFGVECELTGKLARRNLRFFEVGISYDGRSFAEGKKTSWRNGLRAIWCVLKYSRGRYRDVGAQTLHRLQDFDAYSRLIFSHLEPHLGSRVLEAGSGMGSLAPFMLTRRRVILSDCNDAYLEVLRQRYRRQPNFEVHKFDMTRPNPALEEKPVDTVISCNVLEHVEDDRAALKHLHRILDPGGRLVLLVPAHKLLFSALDTQLGHHRRYRKQELLEKFREAGFEVERAFFMNLVGAVGWLVAGRLLRAKQIGRHHVGLQKLLLPISRLVDFCTGPFAGLSLIVIGRKPNQ